MMLQKKEIRNTFFNFRLSRSEMEKIRQATIRLGYISFAEFIRRAIREKIEREVKYG